MRIGDHNFVFNVKQRSTFRLVVWRKDYKPNSFLCHLMIKSAVLPQQERFSQISSPCPPKCATQIVLVATVSLQGENSKGQFFGIPSKELIIHREKRIYSRIDQLQLGCVWGFSLNQRSEISGQYISQFTCTTSSKMD